MKKNIFIFLVFIGAFSLRVYDMDNKYPFGWDQVNNAWAAQRMIVNHNFPLVGMVVKQNTGFFIGPSYYYLVAFFYYLTNLNPVASHYIALATSVFTFFIIFFFTKKLFNFKIALMACFINYVSFSGFIFDIVQWPVELIPGIGLIIFYFLFNILNRKPKYILPLAFISGFAFHIHFTAILFPIIIVLCLPFFPRNKRVFFYLLLSIPLFLIWLVPNLVSQLQNNSEFSNMSSYLATHYHGLHLKRFFQLTGDGLIQFDPFLYFQAIKSLKLLIIPIFLFLFLREKLSKERIILAYLILLFFLVPWLIFATYKGEISDYYFSINRFIALFILSYLIIKLLLTKNWIIKIVALGFIAYYSYFNLSNILQYKDVNGIRKQFEKVQPYIESGRKVEFVEGMPESYIYYYLMRKNGKEVY